MVQCIRGDNMKDINKCNNLTGRVFGMLTVLEIIQTETRKTYWLCQCECGNTVKARSDSLLSGETTSCKCKRNARFKGNTYNRTHNMCDTRLYHIWQGIKRRCYYKEDSRYVDYGGRGITVCDEWLDNKNGSINFINWALSNGYSDDLTIERVDNNKGYLPDNCKWATMKEQSNNRRSNIQIKHNGDIYTLMQICELLELPYRTITQRYNSGERGERLIRAVGAERKSRADGKGATNKITEEQARAIKEDLKEKVNCIELAKKHLVSKHIIYDIKRGKTWAWL